MLAARVALMAHVTLWSIWPLAGAAEPVRRSPETALAAFLPDARQVIGRLALDIESLEIRANRCALPLEGERDDMFYVWIGLRGIAAEGAAQSLAALRAEWSSQDWRETRFRRLGNGGVNLAATDPETGNSYSFDSGFAAGPNIYVVGYLATPCFLNPEGPVAFGGMDA